MISSISQLVAQVESGGNQWAVRFEPSYHPDAKAFLNARVAMPGLSFVTYETLLACSWGQFQIMGDNLYMLGLKVSLQEYCSDPAMQEMFFLRFCAQRNIAYTLDEILNDDAKRQDFAHHYNGNTIGYSTRMLSVYHAINGEPAVTVASK